MDNKKNNPKRKDYLEREEYFMATALLAAKRSKDPITQVGACIVNDNDVIVRVGYNCMPEGNDDKFSWGRDAPDKLDNKSFYVCHAELNAVLNNNSADLKKCTIYVSLFPCNECAKIIIQSGIKKVVFLSDKLGYKKKTIAAKRMFDACNIKPRQFTSEHSEIVINFGMNQSQSPTTSNKRQRENEDKDEEAT